MNGMGLKVGLRPVKDKSKGEGTVKKRGRGKRGVDQSKGDSGEFLN